MAVSSEPSVLTGTLVFPSVGDPCGTAGLLVRCLFRFESGGGGLAGECMGTGATKADGSEVAVVDAGGV